MSQEGVSESLVEFPFQSIGLRAAQTLYCCLVFVRNKLPFPRICLNRYTIMRAFYTLCLVVTLFYLVSSCELQTHYWEDGKCCKMCGPGKRMLRSVNCEDPICPFCDEGEYQSGYTSETRCKLQPSCDTNLNFLPQTKPIPKDRLSKCQCKPGYYCTEDDDCSTCRKHKICKAGEKILKNGTSVSNTVCEACKSGTFSISDSSNICKEWTTCEPGYDEKTQGSLRSDRICEKGTPSDRGAIVGGVIGILLLLLAGVGVVIFIKKRPFEWKKVNVILLTLSCPDITSHKDMYTPLK
ncbi:CD40 molecule [Triplophysa rosa]|uniref:CD40 molecule n=1 Tax=Triplophysa rosa TaxID=992332 RepID=A0A9W7TDE3_TRIRA|nr:CD40 molecule [Triplophysa rosa]